MTTKIRRENGKRSGLRTALTLAAALGLLGAAAIGVERGCASRLLPWRDRVVAVPAVPSTSGELSDELVDKIADSVVEKLRESGEFSEDAIRGVAQKVVAEATSASTPAASDVVSFSPSDFLPSVPRSSAESERLYLEGRVLYFGLNGVKVDCKRGLELLEEAMELGSLNAQAEVARARYEERQNSGSVYYEDIVKACGTRQPVRSRDVGRYLRVRRAAQEQGEGGGVS